MIERVLHLNRVDALQIGELGRQFFGQTGLPGSFKTDTFADFWNGTVAEGGALW